MATVQTKVNPSDLPNLIGQMVTVRSNTDNSQRRGTVLAYNSSNNMVQIDQNKSHFWVSANNTTSAGYYIFSEK